MFRLCIKDLLVNRMMLILGAVYFLFVFSMLFLMEGMVAEPTVLVLILVAMILYADEKHKTDTLYCSLPIKRSTIVLSRYISVLFLVAAGFGAAALIVGILKANWPVGFPPPAEFTYQNWFAALFPIIFFCAIVFPLYFKYGYTRGIITGVVALLVMGSFLLGLIYLWSSMKSGSWELAPFISGEGKKVLLFVKGVLVKGVKTIGTDNIIIFFSLLSLAMLVVSIRLSIKFFNQREF